MLWVGAANAPLLFARELPDHTGAALACPRGSAILLPVWVAQRLTDEDWLMKEGTNDLKGDWLCVAICDPELFQGIRLS